MTQTLRARFEHPPEVESGSTRVAGDVWSWSLDHLTLGALAFGDGEIVSIQISQSTEQVDRNWFMRFLGRKTRTEHRVHAELRAQSKRVRLYAPCASSNLLEGLPEMPGAGERVELPVLLEICDVARALGARLAIFNASAPRNRLDLPIPEVVSAPEPESTPAPEEPGEKKSKKQRIDTKKLRFREKRARFEADTGWGFVDPSGTIVIPPIYDEVRHFREGRAAVRQGFKWGFIDKEGRRVVKTRWKNVKDFSEGLAAVQHYRKKLWGFVNDAGKTTVKPRYDEATSFSKGQARVRLGKSWWRILPNGNRVEIADKNKRRRPRSFDRKRLVEKKKRERAWQGQFGGEEWKRKGRKR